MDKELVLRLRERYLHEVEFDNVNLDSDDPDDEAYDEVVYYDGGGVEGYGDQTN